MNIPFIDKAGRVIGWTSTSPEFVGGKFHHPEAASHFPGAVAPNYVELTEPSHLAQAGAPAGWTDLWRCIGLCEIAPAHEIPIVPTATPVFPMGQRPPSPEQFQVSASDNPVPVSPAVADH